MTAAKMLAEARKSLGMAGRPNAVTRDYSGRHGVVFLLAPWCQQAVTKWARDSGNDGPVLPAGDRAYTVWHAEDGDRLGLWYAGTAMNIRKYAEPGAVIFFDWGGSDRISAIDHVGIVEVNLGDGRVQTIEANTGNACKRRVRGPDVTAGFWNPRYAKKVEKDPTEVMVGKLPLVKPGAKGNHVKTIFFLLKARGYAKDLDEKVYDSTVYSPQIVAEVKRMQGDKGLTKDGEVGPGETWPALLGV
ncbi:CHAP domain-containing protein [Streptosporangium sp. CA-115845]|uniref:CHAP domain-containing protein n=1 Tax=Streptosporangium sp. CA-115845 TaxID=3240071 RepID=UPI003D8C2574